MTTERATWDSENVSSICITIGWVVAIFGLCYAVQHCAQQNQSSDRRDIEKAKVEPVRLRAAMQGCHEACAPGQVRAWSDKECTCD